MEDLNMPPTVPVQKLGQLLHQEQEPFILQVYLHAKRCPNKTFKPEIRLMPAGHTNSTNFLKVSTSKKGISYCSKIVRAVFNKLNFVDVLRLRKKHGVTENEVDSFSFVCPVSVLEETRSPKLSTPLRELFARPPTYQTSNDVEVAVGLKLKSKRELQQRRKLLFDCIKEALEVHKSQTNKHHCLIEVFGAEELRNFICAKIKCWGRQCGNESSITQLLKFDHAASSQEWSQYGSDVREIAVQISDGISEDLVNELLRNMC